MKLKTLLLSAGCLVCWMIFFPMVVIGGGFALFLAAAIAELTNLVTGSKNKAVDPSAAHDMAMRICFGYRARARAPGRFTR